MKRHENTIGGAWTLWIPVFVFLMLPAALHAGEVTMAWDPNSESNLAGYKLYYDGDSDTEMYKGTGANEGNSPIVIYLEDLSDTDSPLFKVTGLEVGQYYYFALTAFDTDGMESNFSDEVGALVEIEGTYNKAVDGSSGTSSESSGGRCFITGAMPPPTESLPLTAAAVLLLVATAAVASLDLILKKMKAFSRRPNP